MADFKTYEHIVKWIGKGKKRSEGRRARSIMFRMVEDVVVVSHAKQRWVAEKISQWVLTDFAEIRPGSVLTFTITSTDMVCIAGSITQVLPRVLGLRFDRVGKGRYVVFPELDDGNDYWKKYRIARADGHEHFKNMMWDFNAGVCFNPRPAILDTVNKEKRRTWVGDLKKFRRLFLTKVKLGIVQTIIDEKHDDGKRAYGQELPDEILEAIKAGDVHTDLLARLVSYTRRQSYKREATNETVKRMLTSIINNNSIRYRQEYGVLRK